MPRLPSIERRHAAAYRAAAYGLIGDFHGLELVGVRLLQTTDRRGATDWEYEVDWNPKFGLPQNLSDWHQLQMLAGMDAALARVGLPVAPAADAAEAEARQVFEEWPHVWDRVATLAPLLTELRWLDLNGILMFWDLRYIEEEPGDALAE
ncbi:MAG: hypothetical protein JWO67_1501 [Streptosporangiaceae bacterium]|nr:hypothetical protein [Streptosporangiaceae bacterium]